MRETQGPQQGWAHGSAASWATPGRSRAVGQEGRVRQVGGDWRQEVGERVRGGWRRRRVEDGGMEDEGMEDEGMEDGGRDDGDREWA